MDAAEEELTESEKTQVTFGEMLKNFQLTRSLGSLVLAASELVII